MDYAGTKVWESGRMKVGKRLLGEEKESRETCLEMELEKLQRERERESETWSRLTDE